MVRAMVAHLSVAVVVLLILARPAWGQKVNALDAYFESGPLPRLRIEVDPADLRRLDAHSKTYVRARVREMPSAAGEPERVYRDVGLHLKGGFGSVRPVTDRPALTLNFDKFVEGQRFHGLDKLHLNNSVQDGSYMRENLGGWIFRESGCPAPRVSAARVWLNGRDLGVYVLKEGFDGPFYKRFFKGGGGNLYDGDFTDVDRQMNVHLGGRSGVEGDLAARQQKAWARQRELAEACREADVDRRNRMLDRVLDVERFITFLACETLVSHWDGYGVYRNNYRIYHDPASDRLVFLPHGMDQIFQRPEHSLYGNNALVALAVTFDNPSGRKRYLERVAEIRRNGAFKTENIKAQLARISKRIEPLFDEMGPPAVAEHRARAEELRGAIVERCEAIDRLLEKGPQFARFDASGAAVLRDWKPMRQDDGGDAVTEKFEEDGQSLLRVVCKPPGGGTASWRTSELLGPGTYTFSARMKTSGVAPARVVATALGGTGACLRISGNRRATRYTGDNDWQVVTCSFRVLEPIKQVTFICELSAAGGEAAFDPASTRLRRHEGMERALN
jgi:hypothetical protein